MRRLVAAGVGLIVVIVLVLGVKGCLNSRQEQALKDYNRDVASLVQESDSNTDEFFAALTTTGTSSTDVQAQISQLRLRAKAQTTQAEGFSVPGDMKPAHRNLLLTLGLVEESMGKVAEKIPAALSTDAATAEPAVLSITAEMQSFVASDVVYTAPCGRAHQAGARRPRDRRADDPGLELHPEPRLARRIDGRAAHPRRRRARRGRGRIDAAAGAGPARPRPARRERRRRHARRPARTRRTASRRART